MDDNIKRFIHVLIIWYYNVTETPLRSDILLVHGSYIFAIVGKHLIHGLRSLSGIAAQAPFKTNVLISIHKYLQVQERSDGSFL